MMREQGTRQAGAAAALLLLIYLVLHSPQQGPLATSGGGGVREYDACPVQTSTVSTSVSPGCSDGTHTCGIVISVSGQRHYDLALVLANIENIRLRWHDSVPVELWFNGAKEVYPPAFVKRVCELGGVRLRNLARYTRCVKYYCKVAAMELTSFDRALVLDANALLFQPPRVFFERIEGPGVAPIYLFRDYQACFASLGRGYTQHGLGVSPETFCELSHGQEIDSSAIVFDRRRAAASLADTVSMRHRWLVGFLTLGDKDTWLLAAIRTGTAVTVHSTGPSFFVFQGKPLEGHLHLDGGSPLYGNIQMLSACSMPGQGLTVFDNAQSPTPVSPMCEAKLTDASNHAIKPVNNDLMGVLEAVCRVTRAFASTTEGGSSKYDDARPCKFTCGARTLRSDVYVC
eukprot:m.51466 g.51466  ORF g.51466 m.51466 type:complete len:401 (-) comp7308_c0_seq1:45-1247(-)